MHTAYIPKKIGWNEKEKIDPIYFFLSRSKRLND